MNLTKKEREEVTRVYDTWFNSYITGDVESYDSFFDDRYHFIGSTENEHFLDRRDTTEFFANTGDQFAGKTKIRNNTRTIEKFEGLIFVTEIFDTYFLIEGDWTYYGIFRFTSVLKKNKEGWRFIYQHFSMPDTKAEEGETIGAQKIANENLILKEAVRRRTIELEHKTRELEIESALERVRAIAMSMQKPDDLLDVCQIISEQLEALNVKNIRNVQLAIIDEERTNYANYQYFTAYLKKVFEETQYGTNPSADGMVRAMQKSVNSFFIGSIHGEELKNFIEWRNKNDQFPDPLLDKSDAVYYYFYSIGKGGLGLTTYKEISKESLEIFKRFHKVFTLAYQRFNDIRQALAQAREAQIEAALERVRARAMAMHKADELVEVTLLLRKEMGQLGVEELETSSIYVHNESKGKTECWFSIQDQKDENNLISDHMILDLNDTWVGKQMQKFYRSGNPATSIVMKGKNRIEWISYCAEKSDLFSAEGFYGKTIPERTYHLYKFKNGYMGAAAPGDISAESWDLLKRATAVFSLAYTRFSDLKKAEAQAREAQIEAALERVRAASLAMHKTDELKQVIETVFSQLRELKLPLDACYIDIFEEDNYDLHIWVGTGMETYPDQLTLPYLDHPLFKLTKKARLKGESFFTLKDAKKSKDRFVRHLAANYDVAQERIDLMLASEGVDMSVALSENIALNIYNYQGINFSEEENQIIRRFSKVFQQAYSRFLDLQKAEAQARESQIQLALERVRARTMAMQSSEELAEVSYLLNKQVVELGIPTRGCAFNIYNEHDSTEWFSNLEGTIPTYKTPRENFILRYYEAGQRGERLWIEEYGGERIKEHYKYLATLPVSGGKDETIAEDVQVIPEYQIDHVAYFKYGYLLFITLVPAPEAHDIFKRLAREFEQTYTRFLDLQKAEAQARESQIQLGLERVRARAMAMHKSEQLAETAKVLFEQFNLLGKIPDRMSIGIINEETGNFELWVTDQKGETTDHAFLFRLDETTSVSKIYKAWKKKKDAVAVDLTGQELKDWLQFLKKEVKLPINAAKIKGRRVHQAAFFSHGFLLLTSHQPVAEEIMKLLVRFAGVFDLTYTRFLDLKKAEAQTHEAQIEASLERLRAKTMSMQRSEDLSATISTVFSELERFGFNTIRCGIGIFNDSSKKVNVWTASKSEDNQTANLSGDEILEGHPLLEGIYEAYKNQKDYSYVLKGEDLKNYYSVAADSNLPVSGPNQAIDKAVQYYHCVMFPAGGLFTFKDSSFSEDAKKLMKRFADVFNLAFRRHLDLRQAESQAREAQIEAALERVRSRSMGMQKSDELKEVIRIIYDQFDRVGINVDHTGFIVDYKKRDDMLIWLADQNGPLTKISIPYFDSPHWNSFLEAKKSDKDFFANQLDFETKNKFYKKLFKFIPDLPEESRKFYFECPGLAISTVLLDNVGLYIENFSGTPYSDEENKILMRFGKVFQQSYTRFLDLEKAEAQTREAQIEASLEKVRGVALSLQKSDQMLQIAQVLYEQLLELGFNNMRNAIIDIKNGDTDTFTDYDYSHEMSGTITQMSYHDDPTLEGQFKKMATTTSDFFELILEGKELEDLKKMRIKNGEAPDPRLDKIDVLTYNLYSFGNGAIGISNFGLLSEEEKTVLARFNNVFTFAYKRYNDMLQAEHQAREALVELSLERIRAQVTAMQESTDLLDIVVTMQTEFNKLGHEAHYFWHMRWLPDKYEKALTNAEGDRIGNVLELPRGFHGLKNMMDWEKSDEPSAVFALDPDTAADYIDKMIKLGHFQEIDHTAPGPDEVHDMGGLTFVMARTTHGEIGYTLPGEVPNPPKEDIALLVRFAGVFDLAYRRFEDLKSAERQNRETQIDLALERVRAKTMAMQKSEELSEVVTNLFHQLDELGIKTYRCNLGIINDKTKHCRLWSTTSEGKVIPLAPNIPLTENKHLKKIFSGWKKQGAPFVEIIHGKNRLEWTQYIRKFSDFEEYEPEKINKKKILSEPAILNQVFFKQGFFTIHTVEEMKDEYFDIIQRFARVFEQTYTRFLDLQRAEVQASEAIKQASLDRIRGQIASMRTTEDLKQLTPLVWRELTTLEVPFFRCGIFIVDEKKKHVNVYLTTPDGKPLGVLDLDFEANDLARDTVASWKKKEVYQTHWNREEFIAWTKEMMNLGQVKVPEKYQGAEAPPESLHLHFIPFAQGMLYVGHQEQLTKDKIDLVKSLAEAFSFAYARYEDFVVLEEAKERVERALSDLKATQSQLVHAEKMASLGELTAGIAHEIQNPLNFVNNFSEVSTDLMEELKEELQNGDTEEVNAIATDLLQNLEKITHHGKRASNIVKSMLEHSRTGSGEKQLTDLNALADEYLRLAYHGLRAKDKSFNADFKLEADEDLPMVKVLGQDIGRVLLNLINNAFYAVSEKAIQNNEGYKPNVIIKTKKLDDKIEIRVKDNGYGIPDTVKDKIFQPFFTTKPTGEGTGLGLSLSYDIIKAHNGELKVTSNEGKGLSAEQAGTEFIIILPYNK
ncbi:MAG: nuclear transport factor 2 family protein [Bacteroidetes bacterium]|nr:nuclear transport factor 2 family protein [Bacteroidota bacterium]